MGSQDEQWLLKEKYGGEKSVAFFADCKRLALGEPLAYLIGHAPFLDCKIWLDSRPLIPRPETEHWIKEVIKTLEEHRTPTLGFSEPDIKVLDVCAGSGCIGIAVAKDISSARVDFSEIDARHLPTIEKNLLENNIDPERYTIYHTSLFQDIEGAYDIIVANPPYIDESLNRTDDSVKDFEPHLALFGGAGGLDVITELITSAPDHLKPGGQLWIEHEPEQSADIQKLGSGNGFTVTTHQDQYQKERYSILVLQ